MSRLGITHHVVDLDHAVSKAMEQHLHSLTKPKGSLGQLEDVAIQLAGITGDLFPVIDPAVIILMAADHGVTEEGISAFPAEVTRQMVNNFISGGAGINVLSRTAGAAVYVVDIGVRGDFDLPNLISRKVRHGTDNMAHGPAMSYEEAIAAVEVGMDVARQMIDQGAKSIALGEMGIGNTTASSALLAVLGQVPVESVVGLGTGITDKAYEHKISVIRKSIALNQPNPLDPIDVLAKVGGLEIAGLVGVILESAASRIPVIVDGFITAVAAFIAAKLAPHSSQYLIASHESVEPGHKIANRLLGIQPILQLNLRLGEGSGAALAIPLVRAATLIPKEMSTFEHAEVSRSVDESVTPPLLQNEIPSLNNQSASFATCHEFDAHHKAGVYKAIYERRDIRSFLKQPVEREKLWKILDAAHHAPSVGFMQPWNFIIIESEHIKQKLHDVANKEVQIAGQYFEGKRGELYTKLKVHGLLEAPITLCVTNDPTRDGTHVLGRNTIPETDVYSVVCAIENLWLAARAEGLGVGWVSFYKKGEVRDLLHIPPHIDPIALISIGYTSTFQNKPILESVGWNERQELKHLLFSDTWGTPYDHMMQL